MLHHLFTRLKGVDILLFDHDGRNKGLEQLHTEKRKQRSIEFPKPGDPGQFFFFSDHHLFNLFRYYPVPSG